MTVRILLFSALAAASLATAGCAAGARPLNGYGAEMDRLTADCAERGGILTPIPGATSGRPQADYACEIRGGASRIRN